MIFVVHFDVPDYLINWLGKEIVQATVDHARAEILLNGGIPEETYMYRVSMLPDDPAGKTNFSRLFLEIQAEFPKGWRHWETMRYPGRDDYELQLKKVLDEPE